MGFLVNQGAWIFSPASIEILISSDGDNFTSVSVEKLDALTSSSSQVKTIGTKISSQKVKFVKVIAKKIKALPDWHSSKGNDGWIFLDEVIVK